MTWHAPITVVTGQLIEEDDWNEQIRDNLLHLYSRPGVRCIRTTSQTITQNTDTAIQFNASDRWDDAAWHDIVTNNTRITPTLAGRILFGGHVAWGSDSDLDRELSIRLNGTTFIARTKNSNVPNEFASVSTVYQMNGTTDYVELIVRHDAAGDKGVSAAGNYSPEFVAQYLGPTP